MSFLQSIPQIFIMIFLKRIQIISNATNKQHWVLWDDSQLTS